jgi:hypothetical protein
MEPPARRAYVLSNANLTRGRENDVKKTLWILAL